MIDINKARNNFQKFPLLKQKCDSGSNVAQPSNSSKAAPVSVPASAPETAAAVKKPEVAPPTTIHQKETSATAVNRIARAPTNSVRAANQKFFLISAFKDQNFLKEEYQLAHAQVASAPVEVSAQPTRSKRGDIADEEDATLAGRGSEDKRNNNNSNSNNNSGNSNSHQHNITAQLPRVAASAVTNGMRRSSNASHSDSKPAVTVHNIDIGVNHFKALPKIPKTTAALTSSKLSARQVRPLIHRTIPATAVAAVNAATAARHNSAISYSNKVNNNSSGSGSGGTSGNNNMQNQFSRNSLEQDDIKYIDSDEAPAPLPERKLVHCEQRCCMHQTHSAAKSRIRPKSTIICSTNQLVFEKVNNYKYANGSANMDTSTSARRHEMRHNNSSSIDSSSIKASIEKFNHFSEQKCLPLSSVPLRSHSGTGSTNNLQHHRHSSDFDHYNCNLRLASNGGGSLTRTPYRTATTVAAPSGKVVTSILHPAVSVVTAAATRTPFSSTNSLPTKSTACVRNHELSRIVLPSKDPASSSAAVVAHSAPASYMNAVAKQQEAASDVRKTAAVVGPCDADDSARSTSIRSALPPPSPTSSRYWDRDSSRSALLSSNSTHNHSADDASKLSSDEKSEGLCGLRNIGNTCFMNSVIQCLSHTSELTKFLKSHNGLKSSASKDQLILCEFAKLIREMWTSNVHSVTPMELKRAFSLKHRMYSDYNQQDAQEFLRFFLDSLHSALNTGVKGELLKIDDNLSDNKKADLTWEWHSRHENSLIRDLFVGQLKSSLKCTSCGNTSVTFDPFWDLSVSLPSSSRCKLDACLELFIREEILDGDEMPTCSKCQTRRKCTKSFTIQRFPKYLVIHLKRFSETRWSKLSNIVEFPTGERELNMGPYGSNPNMNMYYSLYGISNHMGSTAGGHYVALCKHPVSKKWHEFNDNIVSDSISENHLVSSSAYILFYERA